PLASRGMRPRGPTPPHGGGPCVADRIHGSRRHQEAADVPGPVVPDAAVATLESAVREHASEGALCTAVPAEEAAREATVCSEGSAQPPAAEEAGSGAADAAGCPYQPVADLARA